MNNLTLIEKLNYSLKKVGEIGLFKCSCGNYKKLPIRHVVNEKVKSCGCLKYRKDGIKTTKEDKIPYRRWINMMCRCYQSGDFKTSDPKLKFLESKTKHKSYDDYGGRGIHVCKEWHTIKTFVDWYHININYNESLDRINNNEGYYPENCKSSSYTEQNLNRRIMSNNTTGYNGVKLTKYGTYGIKVKYNNVSYEKSGFKTIESALIERNIYIIYNNLPHHTQFLNNINYLKIFKTEEKTIVQYISNDGIENTHTLSIINLSNNLIDLLYKSLIKIKENKMAKYLMLVESPSKAKTISKILDNDYVVLASYGHIKDLPKNRLGFDTNDFTPDYNITPDKKKVVNDIKYHCNKDTIVYLGTDFDREGHLITQHLIDVLGIPKERYKRIEFHEITKDAIMHAIANPVDLEVNLADAAIARRVLDRAVGYEISPLLWKKIRFGLSAGRVQSVAVRIITDREEEINAFIPEEFWKIKAEFINPELKADLVKIDGKNIKINNQNEAKHIETSLKLGIFQLVDIEEKESIRNPSPPFTTSTLQQEASRKLGSSVKQTMQTAQQLYEGNVGSIPGHTGGLITYMRTDAVNLSTLATTMAKKVIEQEYGKEYSLETPRKFTTKSKGAQEAHEAIRPVNLALKPSDIKPYVDNYQYKLYDLIWKRTLATQMTSAKVANTTYKIEAGKNKECEFQTKGQRIIFPGFMKAYTEGSDNPESALDNVDKILPNINKGTILNLDKILLEQNFTKPPARYTEASLVAKLEKEGIGRPSTFASTISTIISRGYIITDEDKKLIPTATGEVVVKFLKDQFPYIVDLKFTANIEEKFDEIASGNIEWKKVLGDFYSNMKKDIIEKESTIAKETYLQIRELGTDPISGKPVSVRNGRFGAFVQIGVKEDSEKPRFANLPSNMIMNNVTLEDVLPLFRLPRIVGQKDGKDIKANVGKFGPYLQIEKTYYPLKDNDPYTVNLETALQVIKDTEEWRKNNPPKDRPKGKFKKSFKKK